jgi:hypothetical protein
VDRFEEEHGEWCSFTKLDPSADAAASKRRDAFDGSLSMSAGVLKRLLRGFGANAYGQVVTTIVQIVSVPILLHYWGQELYGESPIFSTPRRSSRTRTSRRATGSKLSAANVKVSGVSG